MDALTLILGVIVVSAAIILAYLRRNRGYLEKLPVPLEKTPFLLGTPPRDIHNQVVHEYHLRQVKKHGKTWSWYRGGLPVINTVDPVLLKAIYVKNFDCFSDTLEHERTLSQKESTVDFLGGDLWKNVRRKLSPTFTSGKLKGMLIPMEGPLQDTAKQMLKMAKEDCNVNVRQILQDMACVVVARCAFGVEVNRALASETDKKILEMGRKLSQNFALDESANKEFQMVLHLPFISKFFPFFPDNYFHLRDANIAMLKQRKQMGIVKNDYAQTLLELLEDKSIPTDIAYSQGPIFFIGGVETVATTLALFVYTMAKYPDIQEQLYQEIIGELNFDRLEHTDISELKLLHACLLETLRMYPPIHQHQRVCTKDCTVEGILFKKGTFINIPIFAGHYLEEHFEDPEIFKPERFFDTDMSGISDPNLVFRTFGGGPRMCIGQRFALAEIKLAAVLFLHKMKFVEIPGVTELKFNPGDIFLLNFNEVNVKIEPRE